MSENPPAAKPRRAPSPKSKREAQRLMVHEKCPVRITPLAERAGPASGPAEGFAGFVFDITWKGLGVLLDHRLSVGARVQVHFESPRHQATHDARVVWCSALPTTNRVLKPASDFSVRAGLEFTPAGPEEQEALKALAASL